jgi:hypothetical protein
MKKISRLLFIIMVLVTSAAIAEPQQPAKIPGEGRTRRLPIYYLVRVFSLGSR